MAHQRRFERTPDNIVNLGKWLHPHLTDYAERSLDDMTLKELQLLSKKLKIELKKVNEALKERM
jgi:hypothetical protein